MSFIFVKFRIQESAIIQVRDLKSIMDRLTQIPTTSIPKKVIFMMLILI